jgi:hypothetical protein
LFYSHEIGTDWAFGQQVLNRWPLCYLPPYHLNLAQHSGIVMGLSEDGITMSLLQLGTLAIRHGWKVVFVDSQMEDAGAALFRATMQAAGCTQMGKKSGKGLAGGTFLKELKSASATYIGINAWSQPNAARAIARVLLTDICKYVRCYEPARMLLLFKHPELLFDQTQILPLFAFMEQAGGSLFAAVRSIADFGGSAIVKNARTVIVHRSHPSRDWTSCISRSWEHPLRTVRSLPDNECFVVHAGQATHVRVKPTVSGFPIFAARNIHQPRDGTGCSPRLYPGDDFDDDAALSISLFGPDEERKSGIAECQKCSSRMMRRVCSLNLCSSDEAHLRSALSLLGRFHLER